MTILEAHKKITAKEISSVELTKTYLDRSKKLNPELNACITIPEDQALAMAKHADEIIAKGEAHPLTGIPYGVKDAICTEGIRSTGAAKILDTYIPPYSATVIEKIQSLGGVIVAKHNCDPFGHGASNENSHYGPVKNPWDTSRVPGGSSGGSAAALAADMCVYAIAEDTGGSIRYPASFCGLSGLRPSYGRNSRYGIMPMASSLDTVGPMTHTVEEIALLMEVMAGHDPKDASTVRVPVPRYTEDIKKPLSKLTIGLPKEYFGGCEPAVAQALEAAKKQLESLGCTFKEVELPHTKYAVAAYYIIVPSEDSSNLARLDGIRYGVRAAGKNLTETYEQSRANGFPDEVKRRIMIGTYALSSGYYDAYYKKAQRVRTRICEDFENAFKDVDVLLTPTAPTTAFTLGEKANDPLQMYMADVFVGPAAMAGVPALSIPCGFDEKNLPIGLQLIGPRLGESAILQLGHQYQLHTDWHTRAPQL